MGHIGIDFGARKAGTTAICFQNEKSLIFRSSEKGQDADKFLQEQIAAIQPDQIFIDAPLTLPSRYGQGGENYFYRSCDKALEAMSPMFLGGLTARAIRLADHWKQHDIEVYETYPKAIAQVLDLTSSYHKKDKNTLKVFIETVCRNNLNINGLTCNNWHEADALLAWIVGNRYADAQAVAYGTEAEGKIWV